VISAQGLAAVSLLDGEKNCVVHSLFCIFILIPLFLSLVSSIYHVVVLYCLCLNPQVSLFVHFLLATPLQGKGRGE